MPRATEPEKVGLTLYLDQRTVKQLDQAAQSEQRSRANMMRLLLVQALEARETSA